ncbi:hypothetical protein AHX68_21410 [Salmonella enterica subsp. enterica serovar Muenchen]|nr:hypothetical protein [Salmonella enterica subsp. enterica serovar Muenchen]EEO7308513.1 hypothetical protein [Salmonella enterica]ECZ5457790.1 hypothetical protein [Salmonella enterica subsp. enterica serovar Muenchen]EDG8467510.1 hypothetical protein [Salmonella enterica subsp. enterica serovar Muenchen]EEN7398945.1 hypothetical protein [Salmonella enterica subsp. enterica serovar Muenchen]
MRMYQKAAFLLGMVVAPSLMNTAMAQPVEMSFTTLPATEVTVIYHPTQSGLLFADKIRANTILGTVDVTLPVGAKYRDIKFEDATSTTGLLTFKHSSDQSVVRAKVVSAMGDHAVTINGQQGASVEVETGGKAILKVIADKDYSKLKGGTYSDSVTVSYDSL